MKQSTRIIALGLRSRWGFAMRTVVLFIPLTLRTGGLFNSLRFHSISWTRLFTLILNYLRKRRRRKLFHFFRDIKATAVLVFYGTMTTSPLSSLMDGGRCMKIYSSFCLKNTITG